MSGIDLPDSFNDLYKRWKGFPTEKLLELSQRAIRDLNMQEILALRLIFTERYQLELQESHNVAI